MKENIDPSFNRYINFVAKKLKDFLFFIVNIHHLITLIIKLIKDESIIYIKNPAIGHYPVDLFLAFKIYGKKTIFVFKSKVTFANTYLNTKLTEKFNVNNNYEKICNLRDSIENLTFNLLNFKKCPSILHMTEKINYSNYFHDNKKLFEFNEKENKEGLSYLAKHNIEKEKYVCFLVRTPEYYISHDKRNREEIYKYRNVNPKGYIPTLEYLINNNYKIIRMGKGFKSKFPFDHKNFIDYALSEYRSDFLDIWLSANCYFCIASSSGIGEVPLVFNRPCIETNQSEVARTKSWATKHIHLPRICKMNNKLLNLNDLIKYNVIAATNGENYKKHNIELLENKPEEILEAIKDLENKIKNGFNNSKKNQKFWKNLEQEWSKNNHITQQWRPDINNKFVYFHDIKNDKYHR